MTTPTPPSMGVELPELPKAKNHAFSPAYSGPIFTEDDMRAYALAAIAADRASASRATPEGFWLAPMEPDEDLCEAIADVKRRRLLRAIEGNSIDDEMRPRGMVPACGEEFRAGRDNWLTRHPAAPPAGALTVLQPSVAVQWAADRYNWLRAHSYVQSGNGPSAIHFGAGFNQTRPALLDLAIDDQRKLTANQAAEAPPVAAEGWLLADAVREILECPYVIEEATVPSTGLDTPGLNLYQVVGTMHVALPRYRALKAALAAAKTAKPVAEVHGDGISLWTVWLDAKKSDTPPGTLLYAHPPVAVDETPLTHALHGLRSEALEVFDGPETSQDVRDVIEWYASSVDVEVSKARAKVDAAIRNATTSPAVEATKAVAWMVWWGILDMKPHWPPFKTREEAVARAATIKSNTEVRPIYDHPPTPPLAGLEIDEKGEK